MGGAKSKGGAAGAESWRAPQLPQLRHSRHAWAAFIAETLAGGPPVAFRQDPPIRSGSGRQGRGFRLAGLAGVREAGCGRRPHPTSQRPAPATGLETARAASPAAHRGDEDKKR